MEFTFRNIPWEQKDSPPGITFDVTTGGEVLFCAFYTRHIHLASLAKVDPSFIAWGGILDVEGNWVRGSLDFGDAPDHPTRDFVVQGICKALNL